MRVENWDPSVLNSFRGVAYSRLLDASYLVRDTAIRRLRGQIRHSISRPIYKRGPYAGQTWTAREAGQLLRSVRIVQRKEDMGPQQGAKVADFTNIRVYAGNYLAYYADIFEFSNPYMRPAFNDSMGEIRKICGVE